MIGIDHSETIAEIEEIFAAYRTAQSTDADVLAALADGKLYELYVLCRVLTDLKDRGFVLRFVGSAAPKGTAAARHSTLKFKASPGMIKMADSHFEIDCPDDTAAQHYLFVDIEFDTLGSSINGATDLSRRHELDIIVTPATGGYPTWAEIVLAVECKAVANFDKGIIKEVLGVRRELSLVRGEVLSSLSVLAGDSDKVVPAFPPFEFVLAFIDPRGDNYAQSPMSFGIEFKLIRP